MHSRYFFCLSKDNLVTFILNVRPKKKKRLFLIKLIICTKKKKKTETKSKKLLANSKSQMQVFGKNRGDRWEIKGRRWERKGKRNNNIFPFTCLVCTEKEKERKKRKKKKIYIYIYKILYWLIRPYELFLPSLFSPNLEGNNMVGHVGK